MLYDFEIYQFSRSFVYWFLLRYNCFSYNIIFFGLKLLGWVSRWQTCVLTAKHKAALLYYKKAFRNTYQNHILKYSLQNVYPKLDFCWALSSGLYCYPGWAEANFLWGAIVNSEKWIFKNSQNLLNKSLKYGGQMPPPSSAPPWT